jgi:hypothetical protein
MTVARPDLSCSPSLQVALHHSERGGPRDTNVVEGAVDSTFHSQVASARGRPELADFKYLQSPLLFPRHEEYATPLDEIPSRQEWADYRQYPGSGRSQFKYRQRPIHRQERNPPLDLPRQFQCSDPRYEQSSITPHLNSHFPAERRYPDFAMLCTHVLTRMFY